MEVTIIGGGLAGCEAAWRLARAGLTVRLFEMRPEKMTPAHQTGLLSELVCSNSLKADAVTNASGLLKAEMELLDSLVMRAARATAVPAGAALAVDRERFAKRMTEAVQALPGVEIAREEVSAVPAAGTVIIASGPLTSDALAADIARLTAADGLFFYDAIAPVVFAQSVDMRVAFRASRYGKGGGDDYINCPLSREEYEAFVDALLAGAKTAPRAFEELKVFEGCLPIEVMAERGRETPAHGPMKPVGLVDPRTGKRPHAVAQLRQDNAEATLYNMVGFQTRLRRPEQERVFRMIPGLGRAEFARLGSIHRNTFIHSPRLLSSDLSLRSEPRVLFAGQITGVEGYLESAAMGIIAGLNAARQVQGKGPAVPPPTTMTGALIAYITDSAREDFQPMNANFGILAPLNAAVKKSARKQAMVDRALADMKTWREIVS
ncbi:MAG TPA: methylenetetrahydrofolate--tRNA-(uracil(54)-C(5))-methyltransferase (FADH(2)-oxidizing) TrmFO [bacterium]|nr:methylenetetrahydrofolate--tRNA-(uracil(54)-C(5))-methyltransferase (FADH(2)-oxidizing) TrmFO [bacterium]